jgi:hypothetical protein
MLVRRGTYLDDCIEGYWSLKELTVLETVTIPSCVLLGWWNRNCPNLADVLPPSLVTICLTDDIHWFDTYEKTEHDLMPILQRFVRGDKWRETVPRLEEFNFPYYRAWEGEHYPVDLFEQNGLRCQITVRKAWEWA